MEIEELISYLNFSSIFWQLLTPIIFSIADILTGLIQAIINKNVDSTKMRNGLLHKTLILLVVILSFVCNFAFNLSIVSKVICTYVVIMETFSIMENLSKAGLDLGKITEILNIRKED